MVMDKLKDLFNAAKFDKQITEETREATNVLCAIVAMGSRSDYTFVSHSERGDHFYLAYDKKDGEYIGELEPEDRKSIDLLVSSGLVEPESNIGDKLWIIRPTQNALELYEELKQEGFLSERGYFRSKKPL